ncbi:MAG TPA: hypothetical protein VFU05_12740 [Cyclobacteriaceae bacterium]|nr:hypothetical protein [Cyclobacteriaceae bacterium]
MIIIPFIYRGFGILVFILTLLISIVSSFVSNEESSMWWGWVIDALILSIGGWYVNTKRTIIDSDTNERIVSDAFFIRMEYWGIMIGIIALYKLFKIYY